MNINVNIAGKLPRWETMGKKEKLLVWINLPFTNRMNQVKEGSWTLRFLRKDFKVSSSPTNERGDKRGGEKIFLQCNGKSEDLLEPLVSKV